MKFEGALLKKEGQSDAESELSLSVASTGIEPVSKV